MTKSVDPNPDLESLLSTIGSDGRGAIVHNLVDKGYEVPNKYVREAIDSYPNFSSDFAAELAEKTGNYDKAAELYFERGDYDKAEDYLEKSDRTTQELKEKIETQKSFNQLIPDSLLPFDVTPLDPAELDNLDQKVIDLFESEYETMVKNNPFRASSIAIRFRKPKKAIEALAETSNYYFHKTAEIFEDEDLTDFLLDIWEREYPGEKDPRFLEAMRELRYEGKTEEAVDIWSAYHTGKKPKAYEELAELTGDLSVTEHLLNESMKKYQSSSQLKSAGRVAKKIGEEEKSNALNQLNRLLEEE